MKVQGKGNEITVSLEPGEIPLLLSRKLSGTAKMHDYNDKKYDVAFSVETLDDLGDITIVSEPRNSYLPEANRIEVYLGIEKYSRLLDNGLCGTRFGAGGKINLHDKTLED